MQNLPGKIYFLGVIFIAQACSSLSAGAEPCHSYLDKQRKVYARVDYDPYDESRPPEAKQWLSVNSGPFDLCYVRTSRYIFPKEYDCSGKNFRYNINSPCVEQMQAKDGEYKCGWARRMLSQSNTKHACANIGSGMYRTTSTRFTTYSLLPSGAKLTFKDEEYIYYRDQSPDF